MASNFEEVCPHCGANLTYDTNEGKRYSRAWVMDRGDAYGEASWIVQCPNCHKTFERFDQGTRKSEWPEDYEDVADEEVPRS